eukprot:362822-Chlamydomonas_euryale.AAC.12
MTEQAIRCSLWLAGERYACQQKQWAAHTPHRVFALVPVNDSDRCAGGLCGLRTLALRISNLVVAQVARRHEVHLRGAVNGQLLSIPPLGRPAGAGHATRRRTSPTLGSAG